MLLKGADLYERTAADEHNTWEKAVVTKTGGPLGHKNSPSLCWEEQTAHAGRLPGTQPPAWPWEPPPGTQCSEHTRGSRGPHILAALQPPWQDAHARSWAGRCQPPQETHPNHGTPPTPRRWGPLFAGFFGKKCYPRGTWVG